MPPEKILTATRGPVGEILLNRPDRLNALDEETLLAIEARFDAWERDEAVSVVILGSSSERAFCAGADIAMLAAITPERMEAWELMTNRVLDRIQGSPLVSVAAIPGYTLGGGVTLAAVCDFRICAAGAQFGQPEVEMGWAPGGGGVGRLVRLIGVTRAKELCLTGRRIPAQRAEAIGLVDRVVDGPALRSEAEQFATALASKGKAATRAIKFLAEAAVPPITTRFDGPVNASLLQTEKARAAIAQFLSRKKS